MRANKEVIGTRVVVRDGFSECEGTVVDFVEKRFGNENVVEFDAGQEREGTITVSSFWMEDKNPAVRKIGVTLLSN